MLPDPVSLRGFVSPFRSDLSSLEVVSPVGDPVFRYPQKILIPIIAILHKDEIRDYRNLFDVPLAMDVVRVPQHL